MKHSPTILPSREGLLKRWRKHSLAIAAPAGNPILKTMGRLTCAGLCVLGLGLVPGARAGIDDGNTAFSVQGTLLVPGYGTPPYRYDLTFTLYSTNNGGSPIAGPTTNSAVVINSTNGSFTTFPNFGSNLDNSHSYWLEIGVRTNGVDGDFTTLSPRQAITPAPQAYYAASAGVAAVATTANNFAGTVAGDVSGSQGATVVTTVGGQTAANIASATVAANGATSTSTPDTLVARDDSGSFAANSATLGGVLNLPFPAVITSGGTNILIEEGSLYMGFNDSTGSIQASVPDLYNTGFGDWALHNDAVNTNATGKYNTAIGEYALSNNIGGSYNTAGGYGALQKNTIGNDNKADGYEALYANTTGNDNTANGAYALYANTNGYGNEANGYQALLNNENGYNNTANGYQAMRSNTSGYDNVANGWQSLYSNTTGWFNTANGIWALLNNTTGNNNTANGYDALGNTTTGSLNTADGVHALLSNSTGANNVAVGADALNNVQTGTNNIAVGFQAGINFATTESANIDIGNLGIAGDNSTIRIGTTNIQNNAYVAGIYGTTPGAGALSVVVDSTGHLGTFASGAGPANFSATNLTLGGLPVCPDQAGVLNLPVTSDTGGMLGGAITLGGCGQVFLHAYGVNNFFGGLGAGNLTLTGANNTGLGFESLAANTIGADNTASGSQALHANTGGNANTASGYQALWSNTTGVANTASGEQALFNNTTGNNNTAQGVQALYSNTTGFYNTAQGVQALYSNTTGYANTASGQNSLLLNTTGYNNTANGFQALYSNTTGSANTANGVGSLDVNTTGSGNTAGGYSALGKVISGTNNIALGYQAGYNLAGSENQNIDIGNLGVAGESGIIRIGTPGVQTATYLTGPVYANAVQLTSDRNAKENFQPVDGQVVLARLAALPVTEWNYKTDQQGVRHLGPMAQDFQAAFGLDGGDDKHISVVDEGGVALAAIQALNQQLQTKTAEVDSLTTRVSELETLVQKLAAQK